MPTVPVKTRLSALFLLAINCTAASAANDSVTFASPIDGQVVRPGESIAIVLDVDPSLGATGGVLTVMWGQQFGAMELIGPPFETTIEIPADASGALALSALIGMPGPGMQGFAELELQVVPAVSPASLRTVGHIVQIPFPDNPFGTQRIDVFGIYPDGATRNVSDAAMGTIYESDNPGVAVVDGAGKITPVAPGRALVSIRNGGATTWIVVDVLDGSRLEFPPVEQTHKVAIHRSGFRVDLSKRQYVQTVRVTNNSAVPILAPLRFVFEGLPDGMQLVGGGKTKSIEPTGEWCVLLETGPTRLLGPGESTSAEVAFYNPDGHSITYDSRLYTAIDP